MNFSEKLESHILSKNSCLFLGLAPSLEKMPDFFSQDAEGCFHFCCDILDATEDFICGIKIQIAYFEVFGSSGIAVVEKIIQEGRKRNLIVLIDGNRNDIEESSKAYAFAYLDDRSPLSADALTVNAYLGSDGIIPFVKKCEENDRGIFILTRTANPSAKEFQSSEDFCVRIAEKIEEWNISTQSTKNFFSAIGAVVGATESGVLKFFREEMPHTWILASEIETLDDSFEEALSIRREKLGVVIPLSHSILYASSEEDYKEAAREKIQTFFQKQS